MPLLFNAFLRFAAANHSHSVPLLIFALHNRGVACALVVPRDRRFRVEGEERIVYLPFSEYSK